jgi:hypothetical protein
VIDTRAPVYQRALNPRPATQPAASGSSGEGHLASESR